MNSSDTDTTAVNPRNDGANKTDDADQDTGKRYHLPDPKSVPEVSPGPDTREEPNAPK